ncbi:TIGR02453 family protein [Aestuariicoccus sp. MJ-SS9]|uniref:TIGR02453 family protein n=1 Tax=Aestuariicoccus sp. MJ-SS9 TaxID=3079855 RepID=UPI002910E0E7|nr:TIGR02453 family protein [Aestuariicoccus sp. MJ-SS9]MDU8912015.1 TIGR02453 family protein [Aestuariicoccus sp. MJ-SS9]
MPDPIDLTDFVAKVRVFLSDLTHNNDRDWFRENKSLYDADLKRPAERILADIAPALEARSGAPVRTKLFRPHRDIRFSEDKTPFHTHLHMLWSLQDGRGWYFGLSTEYATAGAGIMAFDAEQLGAYRDALDGPEGENLDACLRTIGGRMDPPTLKRVPQPYPADHPRGELLRRKGLVMWRDGIEAQLSPDPVTGLMAAFDDLQPVQDWLGRCVADQS